jgi:hypothetical protein
MAAISPGERDRPADVGAGKLNAAYLEAADWALGLLRDPAVAAAWQQASALPRWRVSGLAGHLSQQVRSVREVLAGPVPDAAPIGLFEHYARAPWVHADIAVSAGIDTPTLPGAVLDPVVALLSGLAVRRHGQAALLRAFARVERAPVSSRRHLILAARGARGLEIAS